MKKYIFFTLVTLFAFNSCDLIDNIEEFPVDTDKNGRSISGYVQKGPFTNGTSITVNELDRNLTQTGITFNTQTTENNGSFEINNIKLMSNYAKLRADGYYFNEVAGKQSNSPVTLYSLINLSDKTTKNINVLSHLEIPRVEYLISKGASFQDAKKQAQLEILEMFNIPPLEIESSEKLDISRKGDGNAILLAISLIFQGNRTEGELTELLSNVRTDLREDGELNNNRLGSQLISHAVYLDTVAIRKNLETRYSGSGVVYEVPHFEKYLKNFIENTSFEITESLIEYPDSGIYGPNILDLEGTTFKGQKFSLSANLAKGTQLKIKITSLDKTMWFYQLGTSINWNITSFDEKNYSQTFTAIDAGKSCDLNMLFNSGEFLIEYFEMGKAEPTRVKTITTGK